MASISGLWWISTLLEIALIARLVSLRLHRSYPFFLAYLALDSSGAAIAALGGGLESTWYCVVFWIHEPLQVLLTALTFREMF